MNEHVTLGMMVQTAVVQSKLLRTIKSFLLLFLLSSQVFASALASQSVNVKITLNNPTVGNVVEELHQQTGGMNFLTMLTSFQKNCPMCRSM